MINEEKDAKKFAIGCGDSKEKEEVNYEKEDYNI